MHNTSSSSYQSIRIIKVNVKNNNDEIIIVIISKIKYISKQVNQDIN